MNLFYNKEVQVHVSWVKIPYWAIVLNKVPVR